tara:strand:+ start:115 stop:1197 length:1083 start_codon:yes stop_codon:yes gene_type:complete
MEQIIKYRSLLNTAKPIDKNNINNYNLGINNIDCDNYEIVLGSDLDIYKVNINDIKLVGILREYPSIIKKFISKKINEKRSLESFIELIKFDTIAFEKTTLDLLHIKITIKTEYFMERLDITLTKLTDSYFQKQIDDIKFREIVLENYVLTEDDKKTYNELNGKTNKTDEENLLYDKIKKNIGEKYLNVFSKPSDRHHTLIKKRGFKLIYNSNKIYFQGLVDNFIDISHNTNNELNNSWYQRYIHNKEINYDLSKHDGLIKKFITKYNNNNVFKMLYKKYKLPFSFNKLIIKNFSKSLTDHCYNILCYNSTQHDDYVLKSLYLCLYTIILDNDNLIILLSYPPTNIRKILELNDEFILLT